MRMRWIRLAVLISVAIGGMSLRADAAPSNLKNTVRGLNAYLKGSAAVKKKDYAKGIALLSEVVDTYAGATWQDGAHYWLAFAHLAHDNPKRDMERAQTFFRRLLKQFPKSRHRWDAENYLKLIEDALQPRREVKRIKEELLKE